MGGGGWKVQMGNVSVSQPFRHFSFPAKPCCVQSEIKSDPDKVLFLWKSEKAPIWLRENLSSIGFFWNGSKTDRVLETYVDNDTYIGRSSWSAYRKFQLIIYILLKKSKKRYLLHFLKENKRRRHISSCCQGGLRTRVDKSTKKQSLFTSNAGMVRDGGWGI